MSMTKRFFNLTGLRTRPSQALFRHHFTRNQRLPLKAGLSGKFILYTASLLGASAFTLYCFNSRSAIHEYFICPVIRFLTPDAEIGHKLGIWCFKVGLSPRLFFDKDDKSINVGVFGKTMSNPIGCAAGFDKDGEGIDGIFNIGFGYVEIGSVTPKSQPGNPKPRFFRLPQDDAVINRYGFNSSGHQVVFENLMRRVSKFLNSYSTKNQKSQVNLSLYKNKLLAVNLGKNKNGDEVKDYLSGIEKFQSLSDVLVINVSSPNTPGLRDLQEETKLTNLLSEVVKKRDSLIDNGNVLGAKEHKPPILVKIAPDLTEPELASIVQSAKDSKIDGIVVSNTTIQRPSALITKDETLKQQAGGLSGKPLKPLSLKALKTVAKYAKDSDLVLVGCGGISSGKDAIEFAKAGATFVQLYTAFAYSGPGLIAQIKDEITSELAKEGKTWMQIIGEDNK
ncbi:probable Dihydroorotate dehydrogenase (quinone), mitochondrial [Saccharomycodes ludwigii]|uniref:Dihydroorotate dehydrogenase (quinone), mitochondrial n=1 Tax=Saccharomycodes ludwigii TaxID=36035 RepID=A0A376B7Q7_9ASCO|nr:probable Dihydroorotate dehydrogenase (quinone), mitochondrial [Saccharomycodes ludwigii]